MFCARWCRLEFGAAIIIKLIMWFLFARLIKTMHVKCIHTRNKQLKRQLWVQVKPVFTCLWYRKQMLFPQNPKSQNTAGVQMYGRFKQIGERNEQIAKQQQQQQQ